MREKKLFYKIGEVSSICGIEAHVLRYWETEFPMLSPSKNRAGQRIYRQKDLELVETIRSLLYEDGFTIAGARRKLQSDGGGRGLPLFKGAPNVARKKAISDIRSQAEAIRKILDDTR